MFPRSAGPDPTRSATFREAAGALPRIADLGFDIVYLPPIHPIGTQLPERAATTRCSAAAGRSRQPVGDRIGGRRTHGRRSRPRHGRRLRRLSNEAERSASRSRSIWPGSASPDHPWVREHPEWFRHRPDGTIKYAENPPKKYQDIYPFDFEIEDWPALWHALLDVTLLGRARRPHLPRRQPAHQDVRLLGMADRQRACSGHPDVIFLSEAFTRPTADALSREGRLHPVVHLFHVAEHQGRDRRATSPSSRRPSRASTCGRICSRTRPTSCTRTCSTAAGRRSRRGCCWRRRSARATASTAASSSAKRRALQARHRRNTPNSEKYQFRHWDWRHARQHQRADLPRQRHPPRSIRALQFDTHAALSRHRQPRDHRLQQDRTGRLRSRF